MGVSGTLSMNIGAYIAFLAMKGTVGAVSLLPQPALFPSSGRWPPRSAPPESAGASSG